MKATETITNEMLKVNVKFVLSELADRLTGPKPYATLTGVQSDIDGLKDFDRQLHELPEDDTEVDVLLSELCAVRNEMEYRKRAMLFWMNKKAAA